VYGSGVLRLKSRSVERAGCDAVKRKQFGFAVSMNDNDNESQNLLQSMVSNVQDRVLTDPTTWALLELKQ